MKIWLARLSDFFHYKDLLKHLVMRDIKLKYRRSVLGYLWSVLDPLLTMIVMTIVFSAMFSRNIDNFPVYLFCGQLLFNFMKNATSQAMHSINANGALIRKAYVPKYIFTFSKVISTLIDLLFNMVALVIVMLATGAGFSWYNLLFPIVLVQLFVFCLGLGLFLAQANVFFKDVQYIYNAVTMAWMYLTPIFYPIESLPEVVRFAITHFNPMYYYVKQFRDIFYTGTLPQGEYVLAGCAAALVMLVFGTGMFLKNQDRFILHI
ncbi:MAG: ABC transporter permease [Lachnospiraceae bacterium]